MFRSLSMVIALSCVTAWVPVSYAQSTSDGQSKKVAVSKHQAKKVVKKSAPKATIKKASIKSTTRTKKAFASKKNANIRHVSAKKYSAPALTVGELAGLHLTKDPLSLRSNVAYVIDQNTSQVLYAKNANVSLPIASVTKLMTAYVVMESGLDLKEVLEVTDDDVDRVKHSGSRLRVGARLTRDDMLHIALMSSENRAASSLGRTYPGGLPAFVAAMNAKARELGMTHTHYVDSTGLSQHNVSSASDLAKLVRAAYRHSLIRHYSTDSKYSVNPFRGNTLEYASSNRLIRYDSKVNDWDIGLQKTGFINEAGHCLVMQNVVDGRPLIMVFLDSQGKLTPVGDASRMRHWITDNPRSTYTQEQNSLSDQAKAQEQDSFQLAQKNMSEFIIDPSIKNKWLSNMGTAPVMESARQPVKKPLTYRTESMEG